MYPLMNLETVLNKESIDKIRRLFTRASAMYPLTNLEIPVKKEFIDKTTKTFY